MSEHIEEQPYDNRHNMDYPTSPQSQQEPVNSFRLPIAEELDAKHVRPAFDLAPGARLAPAEVYISTGLVWRFFPGQELQDLGRITAEVTAELSELDLRVILAHLDSAAHTIQTELGKR